MPTPAAPSAAADFPGVDLDGWNYFGKLLKEFHPELRSECGVEVKQEAAPEPHGEMLVAASARASRAARSPPPSDAAQTDAWAAVARAATAREAEQGLARLDRQPVVTFTAKLGRGGSRSDYAGSAARPAPKLSHVFSLQRPIESNARESSFLVYQSVLPLESASLAAAGMRSNSVRASVVHKVRKTQGGGQQTTRNNLQDLSASWAGQAASVAIALGAAEAAFGAARSPGATCAASAAPLVAGARARPDRALFVMTSSTRLLPHALPTRINAHNFLTTMQGFAMSELEAGAIRSLVPQQVASLRTICNHIVDKTDGVSIWAAWVLLVHMLSDPRLRRLVQASPVSDGEVAVAYLFTNYARAEVTRRARAAQKEAAEKAAAKQAAKGKAGKAGKATAGKAGKVTAAKRAKTAAPKAPSADDKSDGNGDDKSDDDDARTVEAQVALQTVADKQTLSLKRKRPASSGVVQVSGGVLDYWSAALASEYASILKLMITQSKALANQASIQTLTGQAPAGFDVERNALLVNISSANAVKSAEALSSLVVTTAERVPKIVTWRCRGADGKVGVHTGLARSQADASNTTLHAVAMPPSEAQEASGHHAVLWSLAVRNTTPHDASTSLVPGVAEGLAHHHHVAEHGVPQRHRARATRVLDTVAQRTQRAACDGSLDVALTGVARGFVALRAKLVVSESQLRTGALVAERMRAADFAARERARCEGWGDFETRTVLSEEPLPAAPEPYATPASNLTLALRGQRAGARAAARQVRAAATRAGTSAASSRPPRWARLRARSTTGRSRCCRSSTASVEFLETTREPGQALPNRRDASLRTAAITLTVCGDAPVRLADLLELHAAPARPRGCRGACTTRFEALALLHGGAARASELNDVAASDLARGTSTRASPRPSASSWATSTCASTSPCTRQTKRAILNHTHAHTHTRHTHTHTRERDCRRRDHLLPCSKITACLCRPAAGLSRGHEQRAALL